MKMIMISEEKLDEILQQTREKLELENYRGPRPLEPSETNLASLHRQFNYHLCNAFDRIKKEE